MHMLGPSHGPALDVSWFEFDSYEFTIMPGQFIGVQEQVAGIYVSFQLASYSFYMMPSGLMGLRVEAQLELIFERFSQVSKLEA